MGKVGKSSLHLMSACTENSTYLNQRMEEYTRTAPFMMKSGPQSAGDPLGVAGIGPSTGLMQPSSSPSWVSCQPCVVVCVRVPRTGLLSAFRDKLAVFWALKKKAPCSSEEAELMSKLLHEASVVWPLDTEISAWLDDQAATMKQTA